jgi:hypothetical protein
MVIENSDSIRNLVRAVHGAWLVSADGEQLARLDCVASASDGAPLLAFHDGFDDASGAHLCLASPTQGMTLRLSGQLRAGSALERARWARRASAAGLSGGASPVVRFEPEDGDAWLLPSAPEELDSPDLANNEQEALDHLNGDHPEIVEAVAAKSEAFTPGEWRVAGIDPDGMDLACGGRVMRIDFPANVWDFAALRQCLKAMVASASPPDDTAPDDIERPTILETDAAENAVRAARGQARRATTAWLLAAGQAPAAVAVATDLDGSLIAALPNSIALDPDAVVRLAIADDDDPGAGYQSVHTVNLRKADLPRQELRFYNRYPELDNEQSQREIELAHATVRHVDVLRAGTAVAKLGPDDYLLEIGDAPELTDNEQANLEHQNTDHMDINEQLCTQILGRKTGEWRLTGLDPEGMDFQFGTQRCRLPFPAAAFDRKSLGDSIKAYLKEARARLGIDWTP